MNEAKMQVLFRDYIKQNPPSESETYELKISKYKTFPLDKIKKQQIPSLLACRDGFFYKITDPPIFYGGKMRFNIPRPFDCLFLKKVQGYFIFWFYKPRQPKKFIKVKVDDFVKFIDSRESKSFKEEEILNIASEVLNINIK
jgi:hypothetical protein